MPKKKRKSGKQHGAGRGSRPANHHRAQGRSNAPSLRDAPPLYDGPGADADALAKEFEAWLTVPREIEQHYRLLVSDYVDLKARYLGRRDPARWTERDVLDVVTELLPAKVMIEHEDRVHAAGAMDHFLRFLAETGRSLITDDRRAQLVARLECELPDILDDATRRSMNANLLTFATSQGVDLADEREVAAFMEAFNDLDHAGRTAVTDTGALPPGRALQFDAGRGSNAPGARGAAFGLGGPASGADDSFSRTGPFADGADDDEDPFDDLDDVTFEDIWPPMLGPAPDFERGPLDKSDAELAAFFDQTALVTWGEALRSWLGDGRPLTKTGALRRADVRVVVELLGLDVDPGAVRSMWDVPQLAHLWSALLNSDFLAEDGSKARPHAGKIPWSTPADATEQRIARGMIMHTMGFLAFFDTNHGESIARIPPITATTLLKASEPDGFSVPAPAEDPADRRVQVNVVADLNDLVTLQLLERRDDVYFFPEELLPPLSFATELIVHGVEGERGAGTGADGADEP